MTLSTSARTVSVTSAAQRLITEGRPCHLVWDPLTGDLAQLLPVVRAGRALGTREHIEYLMEDPGHPLPSVNREGRMCVQIGVLGSPREPFTSCPMTGLGDILGWLDTWRIARRWPAGQPASFRHADQPRSRALWARGGHFGASQVPDTLSVGPGSIDIAQLTDPHSVSLTRTATARPAKPKVPTAIPLGQRGSRPARDLTSPAPAVVPAGAPSLTATRV